MYTQYYCGAGKGNNKRAEGETLVRFKSSAATKPRTSELRLRISLRSFGARLCVSNAL